MPTENARGHIVPLGSEASFTRDVIFRQFGESINDIVPVANVSARAQLVARLVDENVGPTASRPLAVLRGDAPGLHRLEYTFDGVVWLPGSGVLRFATVAAAEAFGTAYPGYLTRGDRCFVGEVEYQWTGAIWRGPGTITPASGAILNPGAFLQWDRGFVDLGLRVSAPSNAPWSSAALVATLPPGFRPVGAVGFTHQSYDAGFQNRSNVGQVLPSGEVYVNMIPFASQVIASATLRFKAA